MTAPLVGSGAEFESLDENTEREHREGDLSPYRVGMSAIPIHDRSSLLAMIKSADQHVDQRWYCVKRAGAMGLLDLLPQWAELTQVRIDCERASFRLVDPADIEGGHLPSVSPEEAAKVHRAMQTPLPDGDGLL